MKMEEIVKKCISTPVKTNDIAKIITFAYYAGCEKTAKDICDTHKRQIKQMRIAASKMRYHYVANAVIDAGNNGDDTIYSDHYAGDYVATFGTDQIDDKILNI